MSVSSTHSYETVYILKPSVSDEDANMIHQKVDNVISKFKGTIKVREDWGLAQLSYPIEEQTNGRFVVLNYSGESGVVEEIERHFKILGDVMRYLTVAVAPTYDYGKIRKQIKNAEEEAKKAKELRAEKTDDADVNEVAVVGKVNRVGRLKYTPTGKATLDFTIAVPQRVLEKDSMGYIEAMLFGPQAEEVSQRLKIGVKLSLKGQLWGRAFRNRQGTKINETKIVVTSLELVA